MSKKIKVLHILYGIEGGGVGVLAYNYSIRLMDVCSFDVAAFFEIDGCLSADLKKRGCNIFLLPTLSRGTFKEHMRSLGSIIERGRYDVVYAHTNDRAFFSLKVAKKLGVKIRIAHAHTSYVKEDIKAKLIRKVCTFLTKKTATQLMACSETAAKWMWGKRAYKKGKVKLVNNAIDVEKFRFSMELRNLYRKELGLKDDELAAVCVARLSIEKNQKFLIDVWDSLPRSRVNKLYFIGDGKDLMGLKQSVIEKGLSDNVIFLGLRDNVDELLNAFDLFVLSSFYEGVPVSVIEAQANGLPCLLSSKISKDVQKTDLIQYVELNEKQWVWTINSLNKDNLKRAKYADLMISAGYDVNNETWKIKKHLQKIRTLDNRNEGED